MSNAQPTKVVIQARLSYAHLFEKHSIDGNKAKYSVSLIISKDDKKTLAKIQRAVEAAKELGKSSKWNGKIPKTLKLPLRDGDEERDEDEAYANSMFFNAASDNAPQVVDRALNAILDQSEVYSGCYANVSINFYPFASSGNMGVAAGLGNVQKVKDGEPLSGRSRAEDDFEALENEYEDDDDFLD